MKPPKKPISEKRLAANRANAEKSTGPRTPEGKAASARNAVRHGFTGSSYDVVRLESLHETEDLLADLIACYQPVNSQELFALKRAALFQHQMLRAARLEAGFFTNCLDLVFSAPMEVPTYPMTREVSDGMEVTRAQNRNFLLAEGFRRQTIKNSNAFSLLLRYQTLAERQYRRAIEEFDRLKALRDQMPNEPIPVPEPKENKPIASDGANPPAEPKEDDIDTFLLDQAWTVSPAQAGFPVPPANNGQKRE